MTAEQLAKWNATRKLVVKSQRMRYALRAGTVTAQTHIARTVTARLKRAGFSILTRKSFSWPPLLYIDGAGRVWREDFRSAEQLIADWKRARKKGAPHAAPQERV